MSLGKSETGQNKGLSYHSAGRVKSCFEIFKIGFDTLDTVHTTAYRSLTSAKTYWGFFYILIYVVAERLNTNLVLISY